MFKNITKALLLASVTALTAPAALVQAQEVMTLKSEMIGENVSVIRFGGTKIHTFHGISNSHIIETANELRVVDAQFLLPHAKGLKKYIAGLNKPLVQIILSHNHPDHWFGAQVFDGTPIATSKNVTADLASGGMRYIKIVSKNPKMKDSVPAAVVVPTQELALGAQNWDGLDVIVEEYPDQESHHSLLIKIPSAGVMIGQDLFYNNMFLVASERSRNVNWRNLLQNLSDSETRAYQTLLVGHGKNGGPDILTQDIAYLDALEMTLEKGMNQEDTTNAMIAQFPGKGGKSFLGISMGNLFRGH